MTVMQIQTDEMRQAMGEADGVETHRDISPEPKASREAVATGVHLAASS